jgi:Ca2+-dependent lipid-binding protein
VTRELGAFVEVEVGGDVLAKTNTRADSRRSPAWNEAFYIDVCHEIKCIKLRVCHDLWRAFPLPEQPVQLVLE